MGSLTELGIGGILALLILKEVFNFLKTRKLNGESGKIAKIFELTKDIFDMHNQKDNDGVYVWYVRRSLEEAIIKLAENIDKQTICFRELILKLDAK